MIEEEIFARVREDLSFLRKLDLLRFLHPPKADRWLRDRWEDEIKSTKISKFSLRQWSPAALYPREFLQLKCKESQEDIFLHRDYLGSLLFNHVDINFWNWAARHNVDILKSIVGKRPTDLSVHGVDTLFGSWTDFNKMKIQKNKRIVVPHDIFRLHLEELEVGFAMCSGVKSPTILPIFCMNKTLRVLKLSNLNIHSLPVSVQNLTALERLDMRSNALASLPETLGNMNQLEDLHVDLNQLESLPAVVGKMTHLKRLFVGGNRLTSLPEFRAGMKLAYLSADKNRLENLPESVGHLSKLRTLKVERNELRSLPESMGNMSKLIHLNVEENAPLSCLPRSISELKNLDEFSFHTSSGKGYAVTNSSGYESSCPVYATSSHHRMPMITACTQNSGVGRT